MSARMILGDCIAAMAKLPEASVDMVLCDLPYGTTACKWDAVIPFEPLWAQYKRLIKPGGAIVLTAAQPFTSSLVMSNPEWFKHEWIWRKSRPTGFGHAKNAPLKAHESVLVFSPGAAVHSSQTDRRLTYSPQGLQPTRQIRKQNTPGRRATSLVTWGARASHKDEHLQTQTGYPRSVIEFPSVSGGHHPTQKPVALLEYLIRTYTQPGDLVFDNTMGSGSTGVAAINTDRRFIGIERDPGYFKIARARIAAAQAQARRAARAQAPAQAKRLKAAA